MASLNFDSTYVPPAVAPEAIPAGWYAGAMSASEMKPTTTGTGAYLECEYTISEPVEYKGRKVYDRINLQNPNPVAVEIGQKQLSAICHATGVIQVVDSSQFHGRPLMIKVGVRPAGPGQDGVYRDAMNETKGYKAYTGPVASAAAVPAVAVPPPAQFPQQAAPAMQQQAWPQAAQGAQFPQQGQTQQPQQAWPQQPQPQQAPAGMPAWAAAPAPTQQAPVPTQQAPVQPQQPLPPGAGYAPAFQPQAAEQQAQAPVPPWHGQQPEAAQPNIPQQAPAAQAPAPQPQAAAAAPQPAGAVTPPWAQQPQQ